MFGHDKAHRQRPFVRRLWDLRPAESGSRSKLPASSVKSYDGQRCPRNCVRALVG